MKNSVFWDKAQCLPWKVHLLSSVTGSRAIRQKGNNGP
jgi:hypothetical protein